MPQSEQRLGSLIHCAPTEISFSVTRHVFRLRTVSPSREEGTHCPFNEVSMKATLLGLLLLGTVSTAQAQTARLSGPASSLELGWNLSAVAAPRDSMIATVAPIELGGAVNLRSTEMLVRQERTAWEGATRGSKLGLLIGAGVGVAAGLKVASDDCRQPPGAACMVYDVVRAVAPVFGGILGAGAGAVVGGLIGSVHPGDHWVRITVPI